MGRLSNIPSQNISLILYDCMTVSATYIVIINYIRLTQFIRHSGVTVGYDCTGQPDMDRCTVVKRGYRTIE